MTYASFQIKKKSLVVMFEIGYLALKTVIDSFDIYTIHSLIKKIFETNWGLPSNNSIGAWRNLLSLFSSDEMTGNLSDN